MNLEPDVELPLFSCSDTHLIEMIQQIGGILIDAIGSCLFEFVLTVTTRQ